MFSPGSTSHSQFCLSKILSQYVLCHSNKNKRFCTHKKTEKTLFNKRKILTQNKTKFLHLISCPIIPSSEHY